MNRQNKIVAIPVILLLAVIVSGPVIAEEQFGRLFTTPAQRQHLDDLRIEQPGERIQIDEDIFLVEEEIEEKEEVTVDKLNVRGLVFRKQGKSTAWVNDSNTFEGGLSSQYINIGSIENDNVEIKIPSTDTAVKVNVGETFDPVKESFKDIISDTASATSISKAQEN